MRKKQIISNAVSLIQVAERARQARVYFFQVNKIYTIKKQQVPGKKQPPEPDPELLTNAATIIERHWRGHQVRHTLKRREQERRLLIGKSTIFTSSEFAVSLTNRNDGTKLEIKGRKRKISV